MPAWLLGSLRGYRRSWLRRDLVAGLTVWAVLIPESLAYASIAGVSPVVGLYAAIPALILYPLFGSSRHLVVGPMSATAALSAGVVGGIVSSGSGDFPSYTAGLALAVAALTVLTLLLLTPLFADLPEPALAAVVIAAVIELVDVGGLRRLYDVNTAALTTIYGRAARADFICAAGALLGVLVFDTLPGLLIGVVLSVVLLLARTAHPHVAVLGRVPGGQWVDLARDPGSSPADGVVVVRVESGLYFANADAVQERLLELAADDGVHALVLDAATVPSVDVTAAAMLRDTAAELHARGVRLLAVGDVGQVRDVLRRAGAATVLNRLYPTVDAAVAATSPGEGEAAGDGAARR